MKHPDKAVGEVGPVLGHQPNLIGEVLDVFVDINIRQPASKDGR